MTVSGPAQDKDFTIVIYGGCLAGYAARAALSRSLSPQHMIIHIAPNETPACAALYGNSTGPSGYEFFRAVGLEEPDLVTRTNTSFSFGTLFQNWPSRSRQWVQCFVPPFTGVQDLAFDSVVNFHGGNLQSYLISAQAALAGKFAHPPGDPKNPLSRAEYGYHFAVDDITTTIRSKSTASNVEHISGQLQGVAATNGVINHITLTSGRSVAGDLFIDASGTERALMEPLQAEFIAQRSLRASTARSDTPQLGAPCKVVTADDFGWYSVSPLQGYNSLLRVTGAGEASPALPPGFAKYESQFDFQTGTLKKAWIGNCVALGNSASVFEPLTPAPMTLLQRSLKALTELMPSTSNMEVEAKEFNRLHDEDTQNASSFHRAHFLCENAPETAYWQGASDTPICPRLRRKITQFDSRGLVVQYDYEPFNTEDWAILHYGMGRRPRRGDVRLQAMDGSERILDTMSSAISSLVSRMPPHHQYLMKFKEYLEKKQNDHAR